MQAQRILVVGGGIAGLSLNLALPEDGLRVELVERSADPAGLGAGLAIQPNAMRVLRQLGVGAAVEAAGAVVESFQYRDRRGAVLCEVDLREVWNGVGTFVGIARTALAEVLASGPDRCRVGTAVTSVSSCAAEARVGFDDGSVVSYDLVVGADGLRSTVRRFTTGATVPLSWGQTAWRSVAPVRPDGLDGVQFWLGTDRFFGLCPVGGGATYGFGNVTDSSAREPVAGRRRRLADRFADFGAPVREYLAAVERDADIHVAAVEWIPEVAWDAGRVVLVGDAAHAMSPMMGQGGCMAIEDAVVLAEELSRVDDPRVAVARFAARRRERVAWVRAQSRALGELIRLPSGVRDSALRERGVAAFHERYRPLVDPP